MHLGAGGVRKRKLLPSDGQDRHSVASAAPHPPPHRMKEMLQAREVQAAEYREHHGQNFASLHEQVQHHRNLLRDQEKIIALLKREQARLRAELLEKSRDVEFMREQQAHCSTAASDSPRNDCQAPTAGTSASMGEELQRCVADRDAIIERLTADVVTAHSSQHNALEECEHLNAELQEAVLHSKSLEKMLEEAQKSRLETEERLAAASGMQEQIDAARSAAAEAQAVVDETKAQLLQAHEERQELQSEVARLHTLLGEVNELREQVAAFRETKCAAEAALRKNVAELENQLASEKEARRRCTRELETLRDEYETKEYERTRALRAAEAREADMRKELERTIELSKNEAEQQLCALEAAQRRSIHQSEEAARARREGELHAEARDIIAWDCKKLQHQLHAVSADLVAAQSLAEEWKAKADAADRRAAAADKRIEELESVADDAANELQVLEEEIRVLRQVRDDDDALDGGDWRAQYEGAQEELLAAREQSEKQLQKLRDEHQRHLNEIQVEHEASIRALQREIEQTSLKELEVERSRANAAELSEQQARAKVGDLEMALQTIQKQLKEHEEATSSASQVKREKLIADFDAERRGLQEKLRMSDAARNDLKVSLDAKTRQLRSSAEAKQALEQQLAKNTAQYKAKFSTMESKIKEAEAAAHDKVQAEEDRRRGVEARLRELQARLAKVEEENRGMRETQLHW